MMLWIDFAIALIGELAYIFSSNVKIEETGKIIFWCGLLAGLIRLGGFGDR